MDRHIFLVLKQILSRSFTLLVIFPLCILLPSPPIHAVSSQSFISTHYSTCNDAHSCDGYSPNQTLDQWGHTCISSSRILDRASLAPPYNYLEVLLVWSDGCQTNWGVIGPNDPGMHQTWSDKLSNINVTRIDSVRLDSTRLNLFAQTGMLYAPYQAVQACGSHNNSPGVCTAWI